MEKESQMIALTLQNTSRSNFKKFIGAANKALFFLFAVFAFTETITIIPKYGETFSVSFFISLTALPFFYISYPFLYRTSGTWRILITSAATLVLLRLSSLGMAFIWTPTYSGYFSTTPLKAWAESSLKYAYDIACVPYVFCMFVTIGEKKMYKGLRVYLVAMFAFTLFQYIVFRSNNETMYGIYDKVNFIGLFQPSSLIRRLVKAKQEYRAYGFSGEPGHNCLFLSAIAIPWTAVHIMNRTKTKEFIFDCVIFAGLFVFAFLTKSPAVYIGVLIDLLLALSYFFSSSRFLKKQKTIMGFFLLLLVALIFLLPYTRNILIRYATKLVDFSNQSTASHYSNVYNDIMIFLHYPLFGCGDGMQGYFYAANVGDTIFANAPEVQQLLRGETGLNEGGAGIPAILGGYGLFGIAIISYVFRKFCLEACHYKEQNEEVKFYILSSGIALFVMLCVRQGIHRNFAIPLIFALQYAVGQKRNLEYTEIRI